MDDYRVRMGMMRGEFRGDFTRDTFDAGRQYSRVLMQQGRVQLDADFNEQTSIIVHYLRGLAVDLMGPHAAPAGVDGQAGEGFKVSMDANQQLVVASGTYYVNGIHCENPEPLYLQRPEESNGYLVYLDVWERHIAAVEDDLIREVALNGPDTACRAKIEWQVRFLANAELRSTTYVDFLTALGAIRKPGTGKLRARARQREDEDREPCLVDPEARYRGPENQLYRVEIHTGGQSSQATFKWSRENSSVSFPIVKPVVDRTVTLAHLGRDARFGLKPDDWVEIINDEEAIALERPPLLQIESINPDNFEVILKSAPSVNQPGTELDKHPYLRRWDHKSANDNGVSVTENTTSNAEWLDLEDGIQVQFQSDQSTDTQLYSTGDYWLIPARTITGDVEWPGPINDPEFMLAHGILHHFAPLAQLIPTDNGFNLQDLRRWIPKLWEGPDK